MLCVSGLPLGLLFAFADLHTTDLLYVLPVPLYSSRMMTLALEDMVKVYYAAPGDFPGGFTGYDPQYPLPGGAGGGGGDDDDSGDAGSDDDGDSSDNSDPGGSGANSRRRRKRGKPRRSMAAGVAAPPKRRVSMEGEAGDVGGTPPAARKQAMCKYCGAPRKGHPRTCKSAVKVAEPAPAASAPAPP
jgi:hypothetical protein